MGGGVQTGIIAQSDNASTRMQRRTDRSSIKPERATEGAFGERNAWFVRWEQCARWDVSASLYQFSLIKNVLPVKEGGDTASPPELDTSRPLNHPGDN